MDTMKLDCILFQMNNGIINRENSKQNSEIFFRLRDGLKLFNDTSWRV